MKRRNKRYFQLLEVMIAMFLVALCALPLIHPHLHMYQEQRKTLQELQMDHIAGLLYADVALDLYENKIPWEQIQNRETKLPLSSYVINNLPYEGHVSFAEERHKPPDKPAAETNYLIKVIVSLATKDKKLQRDYTNVVFIKRKIKEGEDKNSNPKEEELQGKEEEEQKKEVQKNDSKKKGYEPKKTKK